MKRLDHNEKLTFSIFAIITACCTLLVGCSAEEKANAESTASSVFLGDISGNISITANAYAFIDPDTGVNYIVVRGPECIAISPRYNPDGTFVISDVNTPSQNTIDEYGE